MKTKEIELSSKLHKKLNEIFEFNFPKEIKIIKDIATHSTYAPAFYRLEFQNGKRWGGGFRELGFNNWNLLWYDYSKEGIEIKDASEKKQKLDEEDKKKHNIVKLLFNTEREYIDIFKPTHETIKNLIKNKAEPLNCETDQPLNLDWEQVEVDYKMDEKNLIEINGEKYSLLPTKGLCLYGGETKEYKFWNEGGNVELPLSKDERFIFKGVKKEVEA